MICLCCSKPIPDTASDYEKEIQWHNSCIKKFFHTKTLPHVELSKEILETLAAKSTSKGFTIPGVQKKISLHLDSSDSKPRLTLIDYPTGYILKPTVNDYPFMPESEFLVMNMAKTAGIKTVPFALIKTGENNGSLSYITKRIDRQNNKILAMEDFCQLSERLTEYKYNGSYEQCAKIIKKYSSRPGLDIVELYIRLVFSFITGNSDMHLKNFSLIETDENSKEYVLSDAYDLLPVNIINPADTEQTALTLNGKKRNLHRNDFLKFSESCDIDRKTAGRLIDKIIKQKDSYAKEVEQSFLNEEFKAKLKELIIQRITALDTPK